jgi:hypothetical protein
MARRWTRDWTNSKHAPPTAIDLCRGVRAFATGDNDGAIRLLEPAMAELARIGGSHAQRELWEDTLIVAYMRAGQGDRASGRISVRLERRPSARDEAWSRAARGDKSAVKA